MKLFFYIFLFTTTLMSSQSTFKKGYYLNKNGKKVEGFINSNIDNRKIPSSIEFKYSLDSETREIDTNQLERFSVDNELKYIRKL